MKKFNILLLVSVFLGTSSVYADCPDVKDITFDPADSYLKANKDGIEWKSSNTYSAKPEKLKILLGGQANRDSKSPSVASGISWGLYCNYGDNLPDPTVSISLSAPWTQKYQVNMTNNNWSYNYGRSTTYSCWIRSSDNHQCAFNVYNN